TYVYGLRPTQTVFTGAASLQQLPRLSNRITGGRADVQYFLRQDVAVGVVYRFEDYAVRDFALDADTVTPLSAGTSTIYTGYMYRPYTAHTAWLRLTYLW
ncbi:MAG TPA: MtrB/PioB family outer membrane beta-barrel protein, partial [Vicinamibacterales bacterium]